MVKIVPHGKSKKKKNTKDIHFVTFSKKHKNWSSHTNETVTSALVKRDLVKRALVKRDSFG